jgi:hypothetical protein
MLLIVFLSCYKNNHLWNNLLKTVSNCIIFCGNPDINEEFIFKDKILTLKCPDTYDYLPLKTFLMIKAVLNIPEFNNITHIFKVDDHDTRVDANINNAIENIPSIAHIDYCGQNINNHYYGNREWHFNKCPLDSIWHNKSYSGPYVPWVDGGCGYILSRKALHLICKETIDEVKEHIYEDLMIALILHSNNIHPIKIQNIISGDK